jgi:pimeloyl-ACP methyl ester carboxylesterase
LSKASVLFIHGAGGGGWECNVWKRLFVAHGFEVHAPDLLPSGNGLANTFLEDYRQQVHQHLLLMRSPKIIIGASLGGLLALMNADHADAMVLINPMPPAPFHLQMPSRENYPDVIPWKSNASLSGTRRALFDGDEMTCLYAFRHWRDESSAAMNAAMAGINIIQPTCPGLVMASEQDKDVPFAVSKILADNLNASFINLPASSHVGPLLGRTAMQCALQAVAFLNGIFR